MTDILALVKTLRRPRLLIRAARFGLAEYNRETALKRLMRVPSVPNSKRALSALVTVEADLETARQTGDARYSVARHVEVLVALLGELRLVNQPQG